MELNLVGAGNGVEQRFVRVRVEFDVAKSLPTGFPLDRGNLPDLWISFKYEKLGNFCYGCGRLGHEQNDCLDPNVQLLLKENIRCGIYDKWLRADNDNFQPGLRLERPQRHSFGEANSHMHIVEQKEGGHLLSAGNNTQSNQMAMEQVARGPSHSVEGRNVREISFRQQSCPDNNTPQRNELTGTGGSVSHVNLQIVADQPLHIQRSVKFEPILVFSELSNYQKQSQMDLSPWALTAPQTSPSSHYQPIIPVITNYPTCEQTLGPKPKRQFSILDIENQPPNKK